MKIDNPLLAYSRSGRTDKGLGKIKPMILKSSPGSDLNGIAIRKNILSPTACSIRKPAGVNRLGAVQKFCLTIIELPPNMPTKRGYDGKKQHT